MNTGLPPRPVVSQQPTPAQPRPGPTPVLGRIAAQPAQTVATQPRPIRVPQAIVVPASAAAATAPESAAAVPASAEATQTPVSSAFDDYLEGFVL